MIDVVLLLVVSIRTSMLVLENLCQYSFMARALVSSIQVHSSAMHSIELIFDVAWSPWGSLSTGWARVVVSLGDWWSIDLHFSTLTCNKVLGLVATWLYHQALIDVLLLLTSINWLPSIFSSISTRLLNCACSSLNFTSLSLLVYKSHWKLSNIYRVIRILPILINDVQVSILHLGVIIGRSSSRGLNRSESTSLAALNHRTCSAWRYHASTSCIISCLLIRLVLIWEEALLLSLISIVLSIIESHILVLAWSIGGCSGSSYPCGVSCITILPLDWLHHWVIQVDY